MKNIKKETLPTNEEVQKANEEVGEIIFEKIKNNHISPAVKCPKCGKGTMGQVGLILKGFILDAVICSNCHFLAMKCAAYKGSCSCQD